MLIAHHRSALRFEMADGARDGAGCSCPIAALVLGLRLASGVGRRDRSPKASRA